jgi:hypothetical protein
MERYPILDMILRFGTPAAIVLSILGGMLVFALTWALLGWFALAAAVVVAGLIFIVAKSYVELITLITEMLVPR